MNNIQTILAGCLKNPHLRYPAIIIIALMAAPTVMGFWHVRPDVIESTHKTAEYIIRIAFLYFGASAAQTTPQSTTPPTPPIAPPAGAGVAKP